jgi:hypothetical protein
MKKIYILLFSILLTLGAYSQALPNPSFDNWTNQGSYDDPNSWNTLNSITSTFGVITVQMASGVDVHSGAAAIKLITQSVLGQNANGLATTGTINVAGQTVDGGIPYTLRPDSITGWYKCAPQGADYGFVDFSLLDAAGTDTVGFAHFQTPNGMVTTYTRFSIPINYHNANTPAVSRCVISSSAVVTSVLNSQLVIDDLELIFNPNGISENVTLNNAVHFIPAQNMLKVFANSEARIVISDITGKKVFEHHVEKGNSEFVLETLPVGLYLYIISDKYTGQSFVGKFLAE